jgi:hypothetical protein
MPVYKAGFTAATPANGAAYATLNCPTRKGNVHEIDYSLNTAVQSFLGYGTPANESTPPVVSTSITPVGKPSDIACTGRVGTAWSTAPTVPTVYVDQKVLAAVIGSGWVVKWATDEFDEIKIAGWRVIWNAGGSTAGSVFISITFDE